MSATNSIILESSSFASKSLHHEETDKSYPDNLPNFTNPLASNIKPRNDTFNFKEVTSQPDRLDFFEAMRKEIGTYEIDKHFNLVRRR